MTRWAGDESSWAAPEPGADAGFAPTVTTGAGTGPEERRPNAITPLRVFLGIGLVASLAFLGFALSRRDAGSVVTLAAAAAVLAVVLAAYGFTGAIASYRDATHAHSARSLVRAFVSGLCAIGAFGCLAGAVILGILWKPG